MSDDRNLSFKKRCYLTVLPNEILLKILSYLPREDWFWTVGLTCKKLFWVICGILGNQLRLNDIKSDEMGGDEMKRVVKTRLQYLAMYKEILQSIYVLVMDNCDSRGFGDSINLVRMRKASEKQLRLVIINWDYIVIFFPRYFFEFLKKLSHLKALFINSEANGNSAKFKDSCLTSEESPFCDGMFAQLCDYLSSTKSIEIEYLGLRGIRDDKICDAIVKNSQLKYLRIENCYFDTQKLVWTIQSCKELNHLALYGIYDNELKKQSLSISTFICDIVTPYWKRQAILLREQFCRKGVCGDALDENQIVNILNVENIKILPEPLLALLTVASEWHSIR